MATPLAHASALHHVQHVLSSWPAPAGLAGSGITQQAGLRAGVGGSGQRQIGWGNVGSSRSSRDQWEAVASVCRGDARVTCLGGWKKRDAARKALEEALGGKKESYEKWDEEIKKRQESGGGKGRGRGKGWGGGGGGGGKGGGGRGGEDDLPAENKWEEAKQIGYAFFGLLFLYLVLTQGKAMLAFGVNALFFVLRGFKRSPSYKPPSKATNAPSLGPLALGNAEADVISKWGKD